MMKKLIKGAFTLTIAGIIVKGLSAIYRISFQNIVGDTGFYIYQQVYPLYSMAIVFAFSGFPVVISKEYMERKAAGDQSGMQKVLIASFFMLIVLGGLLFITLFFGAESIAGHMNDVHLALSIRAVSFVFLFFPFIALLRGYFQGEGNMKPTAYSQVGEQFVRVSAILIGALVIMRYTGDLYKVGAGAMFGSVLGSFTCCIILICFLWLGKKRTIFPYKQMIRTIDFQRIKNMGKTLFIQGTIVSISNMLLIFLSLADSLNLYGILSSIGISGEEAKQLKGIYDRGQPLIQLGTVVATSMSLPLVPSIALEKVKKNKEAMQHYIQLSLKVSVFIGVGASLGLMAIMEPTNIMLFENKKGTDVLTFLSLLILLSSVIITFVAILQGLGKMLFTGVIISLAFFLKYCFNFIFVPHFGTIGAALASHITLLCIFAMLLGKLYKEMREPFFSFRFVLKVFLAAICMVFVIKGFLWTSDMILPMKNERLHAAIKALMSVVIGGTVYILAVIKSKVFTEDELSLLPLGNKLIFLLPKKK